MKFAKRFHLFWADTVTMLRTPKFAWCASLSLLFLLLHAGLAVWRIVPLGASRPFIPLHYNIFLGVDRLGPWSQIFELPILGAVLFLFNIVLQTIAFRQEKLLATMIAVANVLVELVMLFAMVLIVLLNLSYAA